MALVLGLCWTDVGVVAVLLALEAKHALVLLVVDVVSGEDGVQLLWSDGLFLAEGGLVALHSAVVASDLHHGLHSRVEVVLLTRHGLVRPVLVVRKTGQHLQVHVLVRNHSLDMDLATTAASGTEAVQVVFADLVLDVVEGALETLLAEAALVVGTELSPLVALVDVSVDALLALLALACSHEVLARRDLLLLVDVEVLAGIVLLALVLKPVDADCALSLGVVHLLELGLDDGADLVDAEFFVCHNLNYN